MSAKKKLTIAILSLTFVVFLVVSIVVSVSAAQKAEVQSSISISYVSNDVGAVVSAKYQVANGEVVEIGSLTLNGEEADNASLNLNNETTSINNLAQHLNYVDFIFTFTNTGDRDYIASLTIPTTITNFNTSYTVPEGNGATKISDTSFRLSGNTLTAVTYTVRFTVNLKNQNGNISGTFVWNLSKVN